MMTKMKPVNSRTNGGFSFFQEFLKHPLQIGSIIPSSRFLEQRIAEASVIMKMGTDLFNSSFLQINRQKKPNTLINADHYHGGESKNIGFAKVPAVIKLIAGYPWQVIKTIGWTAPLTSSLCWSILSGSAVEYAIGPSSG